ncbi:MAG: tripartite tricarboxylate transporter TctB family protein [Hyphomicrobiales bacterium]|nr:tripartite tricarboxylate transporter TctB family protein [Hyphomicrobiales bacterium]
MNRDFICGACGLALAVGYYAMASRIQTSLLADDVGPDGLPKAYGLILGFLSLLLMARAGLRPVFAGLTPSKASGDLFAMRRAIGMGVIGVIYIVAVPFLGYPLCIASVIGAAAAYQGGAIGWRLALIALAGAIFLWLIFVMLLHIGQPAGIWPDLWEARRA